MQVPGFYIFSRCSFACMYDELIDRTNLARTGRIRAHKTVSPFVVGKGYADMPCFPTLVSSLCRRSKCRDLLAVIQHIFYPSLSLTH